MVRTGGASMIGVMIIEHDGDADGHVHHGRWHQKSLRRGARGVCA